MIELCLYMEYNIDIMMNIHIGGEIMVIGIKDESRTKKEQPEKVSLIDLILKPFEEVSNSIFLGLSKDQSEFDEKEEFIKSGLKNE